jgi:hypothetical protein
LIYHFDLMPEQPTTTVNYCWNCGASAHLDAKYCQNCGKIISLSDTRRDGIAQPETETDLGSRFSALELKLESKIESKIGEIKQLLSQNNSSVSDTRPKRVDWLIEFSPTFYITLISVIQSLALGYLILTAKDQLAYTMRGGSYDPILIILIVTTFIMIVGIWQELACMQLCFRYVPKVQDAMTIFLFGAIESFVIFSIDFHKIAWWYLFFGFGFIVYAFRLMYVYHESRLYYEENRVVLELAGTTPRINEIVLLLLAVVSFSFGVLEGIRNLNSPYFAIFILIVFIVMIVKGYFFARKVFGW